MTCVRHWACSSAAPSSVQDDALQQCLGAVLAVLLHQGDSQVSGEQATNDGHHALRPSVDDPPARHPERP